MLGTLLRELLGGGSNCTRLDPADIDYGTDAGMQELINSLSPIGVEFDQKRQRTRQRRLAICGMIEDGFALCDARLEAFPQTVEDHEALLQAHKEARRVVLRTLIARYLARSYRSPVTKRHLSKKSQNFYLVALRGLLDFLAERDVVTVPSTKVRLAKEATQGAVSFLSSQDIEKLLAVPDINTREGARDRAIIELLFSSGLRIAELIALDHSHFPPPAELATDQTLALPIVGKGGRTRSIFISPRAAATVPAFPFHISRSSYHYTHAVVPGHQADQRSPLRVRATDVARGRSRSHREPLPGRAL